jgi:hypothetical protein
VNFSPLIVISFSGTLRTDAVYLRYTSIDQKLHLGKTLEESWTCLWRCKHVFIHALIRSILLKGISYNKDLKEYDGSFKISN